MEEVVTFEVNGETLTGILNRPDELGGRQPEIGIVFGNAGARGRLGSTFQYPYYAKHLAALGYPTLRFDPIGIGDSTGMIEHTEMPAFYGSLQSGRFAEALAVASDEFRKLVRPKKLVLAGVCGGAITSLMVAGRKPDIDAVWLLSVPVLYDSVDQSTEDTLSSGYAADYLVTAYSSKLLSIDAWKRLLSGKSEMDTILSYGKVALKGAIPRVRGIVENKVAELKSRFLGGEPPRRKVEHTAERHPMFNDHFLRSLDALMDRKAPVLFVFGEGDAIRWHFKEHFVEPFWQDDPAYDDLCEIHYLPGCNHLFTLREWQNQALDLVKPWLSKVQSGAFA
jgi:pimeloyl-ACP methyl ester carboxylesterase